MQLDIKELKQQDLTQLVKSLELISSELLECITKNSQVACSSTPQMQYLFNEWVELISGSLLDAAKKGSIKPAEFALEAGVSSDTVLSLALTLQRQGKIQIQELKVRQTDEGNHEICECLK